MNYTVQVNKSFEEIVEKISQLSEKHKFRVQHIHRVSQVLNEKGFDIENYAIIEICNPKFAHLVLSKNKTYGIILPCKILVYEKDGKNYVTSSNPVYMVEKFEMNDVVDVAREVDKIIKEIIFEVGL